MKGQEYNILVVDNSPAHTKIIHDTLNELDECCILQTCKSTDEALSYISKCEYYKIPQLIFINIDSLNDQSMKVIKHLKEHREYKKIPIVLLTQKEDKERIMSAYNMFVNCILHASDKEEHMAELIRESWKFWLNTAKLPQRANMM